MTKVARSPWHFGARRPDSVGALLVDEFDSAGDDPREDVAAATSKSVVRGGDRSEFFAPDIDAAHRYEFEHTLPRAIENHDLRVVYQPILEIATGSLVGFEAFVRWVSPMWGVLPSMNIVEIAESTGTIEQIGAFVLSEALDQVTRAREIEGSGSRLWVSVNLSPLEFSTTDLVARCAAMLQARAVSADALRYELSETMIMEEVEGSIAQLHRLHDLGVKVALDDFGTGLSSLAYLSKMPFSALKIDHSFVSSLSDTAREVAIIEAIVAMGNALGVEICAEGIETDAQLAIVERLGCEHGQGYLFSTPLMPDELLAYVAAGIAYLPTDRS